MTAPGVLVVGSLSIDVTSYSERLPRPGETVLGHDVSIVPGGKGANQAVASARAGAPTWIAGCVGDDVFHRVVLDGLARDGVVTEHVRSVPGPTGLAHIRVDASGENDIVVVPLANTHVTTGDVDAALAALAGRVGVLLLQLEVPLDVVRHAAAAGRAAGLTVVLDPAPAATLPESVWCHVDVVTPNEAEAAALTGTAVTDVGSATQAGLWFVRRGARCAVVTLADRGAVAVTADGTVTVAAHRVTAVDTTAAGDAFTGTLGAATALGLPLPAALARAAAAGALAVTRTGATPSLPTAAAVDELLAAATGPVHRPT